MIEEEPKELEMHIVSRVRHISFEQKGFWERFEKMTYICAVSFDKAKVSEENIRVLITLKRLDAIHNVCC